MPLVDTLVVKLLVDGASQLSDLDAGAALLDATTKKLTTTTQKATAAGNENAATNERVTKAVRTTTAQYASFIASQDKASAAALTYAKSMDQAARFVRELQLGEEALTVLQGLVQQKFDQTTAAINKANAATKAYNDNIEQSASHIAAFTAEIDRLKPKYDTVYAAGLKLTEAQKEINLLFRAGEISADLAAVSLAEATAAYDKVATAAGNASRALRSAVPPAYAEFLAEVAAYDTKVEGLAQTYDKVYAAELRFKKVQEDINFLLGANRISQEAANAELREAAALRDKASGVAPVPAAKAQQVFPQEATDHIKAFNAYADQLRVKFDAIYAAYVKQQAALKEINDAFRFNAVTTAQWREETDKINAAYNQTVKEINEVAAASSRVKPPQQQTAQIQAYADEVERLRLKYDPLYAAEQKQVAALAEINNALRLNALTQEQADAEIQATTRAYNDQVLAIQKAAAAARLTPTAGGGDQNAQIKAYNDLIDQQRAKYVPLFAAEQKLKVQLADINKSYQMGALSQTEYIATVDEAVTRHEKYAESLKKTTNAAGTSTISTGQLNAAVTNLGFQINDIASGLLSGQSPFTILVQQGGQVIQAFSQGGGIKEVLGGLRTSIAAMITPTTLAVGGLALLAGAIVYLGARALAEQQRIKDFNNQLRVMGESSLATGAELDASTKSWSKFGLSVTESGKALNDMLLGGLNPKFRDQIAQLGADLGAFTHQGSAAGIQQITTALKGGLQPLIQLGFQYHLITAAEAEHYEAMQRSSKGAEAQIAIFNKLQSALKGYEKSTLGPVTLAVRDLSKAWSDLLDEMGKALAPAAQTFLNGLAELAKIITAAFKGDLHLDITLKMPPGIPDIHIGDVGGPQQGKEVPLAGSSGAAGGGATGRVSMGPNAVAGAGTAQIMAILNAAAPKALPEGQGFQIFSAYAPGGGNRSTGAASLHARGNAGDYRVINIATGDIVDTGVVGLDTMGKGLPTPEMERAVLEAAKAQGVPVSIGGTFSKPDPGHIGVGANEAEVQNNQARQQLLLQGKILLNEQQQKDAASEITRVANEQLEADKRIGLSQAESLAKIEAEKIIKEQGLEGTAADEVRTTKLLEARQKVATETYKENVLLNAQAVTTNTIADSYAKGGLAVVEATAQTQAATEMQAKLGNQVDKTYATEVRRKELLGTMQSQERLQNAQDTQAQKDTQEALTLEISLQGQSSDVITEQLTLLKAKQEIEEKFPLLSEAEKAARLATVKATADQTAALAEVQRAQQRLNDVLTSVGQTIDQDITQNISNALSGQKITQWHTIFKNVLVQLESQLISLSIIKPAIGSVLGFLGFGQAAQSFGTLTGPGGILSGGGAGSLLGGVFGGTQQQQQPITLEQRDPSGNLTGTLSTVANAGSLANTGSGLFGGGGSGGLFGGFGNWLNTSIGQPLGFAQPGLIQGTGAGSGIFMNSAGVTSDVAGGGVASGLFGGTTLTSALGGIGAGATVGSLANSFIGPLIGGGKSTGGMIGSTGGAIAGTLLGSLIGMPFLGGLIGGSAGGLLGGMFGPKPANNAGSGSLNLATGQLGAFTSGGVAANDQAAQGILQPISTTLANITQILGASVLPQATLIAQAGSRDGIKVNIASGEGVQSFTGKDAGTVVQQVAQFLYEHRDLSALSPTLQKAVGTLDINQIQDPTQLTTAVNFSKIYDAITTAADDAFKSIESGAQQAGPFEQAMTQISDTFSQLTDQANKYGLSIDPINAALAEATKRLNVDFAKAVDAAFNTATGSDFLNGVQAVVDNYKSMAREASAIGASSTVFDKLGQTFNAQLNSLFSQMTSTQLNAVLAAFGDLTDNDLPALATAARDAALATEALNASLAQQAQMYQNQNDYYTANNQGFLSQLRDLDKARVATQAANKAVGLGADQDALVQESEHRAAINILMALTNDQMEQARDVLAKLNPAFASWVDEAEAAVKATNDQADASARAAQVLQAQANIQAYLNQLQTQQSQFTSPRSRLDAAQSQYNTMLTAAQGGDVTALQGITTAAQTLLQNVSDYYASSAPGQAIFKQVQDQLTALLGTSATPTQDKTTTDVVNAITDDTATTTNVSNANSMSLIAAGIDAAKQITDNASSASLGVIVATKTANDNIVATTIAAGVDMTNATLNGAASIVGGTATQLVAQTATLMTGTDNMVGATATTTAAVISSGTDLAAGTKAVLDNNVANSASLISNNSNNAVAVINNNVATAAALQTASAANANAMIDANTANALTITQRTTDTTNSLLAANENHTATLTSTAQATTNQTVASAVTNTQAIVAANDAGFQSSIAAYNATADQIVNSANTTGAWGRATVDTINGAIGWLGGVMNGLINSEIATIANWSNAVIANQVAWDNAINGTIASWLSGVYTVVANGSNGIVQAVFAAADSINGSAWNNANWTVATINATANGIVASAASDANVIVGSVWGSASNVIGAVTAYENATRASVDSANNNIANWLNAVNGTLVWSINNLNDRSNEHINKLQEILNNMIGWMRNLWDQLHYISQYISFLTEVTIQFDEWMAGASGAQLDAMNNIQNQLRRNSFG